MNAREQTSLWFFAASVFAGLGVGVTEHILAEQGWQWDWNEYVAVGFMVIALLLFLTARENNQPANALIE